MADAASTLEFDTLTVAGSSVLADTQSVTVTLDAELARNDAMTDGMVSNQVDKVNASFDLPLMSTISNPERVTSLNLSALTYGGVNLLSYGTDELNVEITPQMTQKPNAGSLFRWPQVLKKSISGSVTFAVPYDSNIPFFANMASATYSDRVKVLSFTLNGVPVTFSTIMNSCKPTGERDGLQIVTVEFAPRKPTSGAYPAAPTGTTTLLEKVFNSWRTAIAVTFTNSTNGSTLSGNFIFTKFRLNIKDGGGPTISAYSFVNQGAFTVVDTTP